MFEGMFDIIGILVMPIFMLSTGWTMWKKASPEISKTTGYRTQRSMRSKRAWRFAQDHAGRLRWKMGWVLLFASLVIFVMIYRNYKAFLPISSFVTILLQGAVYMVSSAMTEKALKRNFKH